MSCNRHPWRLGRLLVAWCLVLMASAAGAIAPPASQPASQPATPAAAPGGAVYQHAASGLVFPRRMGGVTRRRAEQSPDPRVGLSLGYRGEDGLTVTVYVYGLGEQRIPDGAASPLVQEHFAGVKAAVEMAGKRGIYEKVEHVADDTVRIGGKETAPRMLYALFKLQGKGEEAFSAVYLTGWRNHFIKVRVTYPAATAKSCEPALQRFLIDLAAVLVKGGGPATAPAGK